MHAEGRPVGPPSTGAAQRVAEGFVAAERGRALGAPHGEVVEFDGIVMAFTNLPDESLNAGIVVAAPADPAGTIAAAAAAAHERGHALGLEVERGRHPELETALAAAGLTKLFSHPLWSPTRSPCGALRRSPACTWRASSTRPASRPW